MLKLDILPLASARGLGPDGPGARGGRGTRYPGRDVMGNLYPQVSNTDETCTDACLCFFALMRASHISIWYFLQLVLLAIYTCLYIGLVTDACKSHQYLILLQLVLLAICTCLYIGLVWLPGLDCSWVMLTTSHPQIRHSRRQFLDDLIKDVIEIIVIRGFIIRIVY